MKSLAGTWCVVGLLSAGLAVAEPKKDSSFRPIQSDQPELITPVKPVPPPPPPQQGNNQQGQFPPGQGPNNNIPPPAAPPAEIQNQRNMPVPVPEEVGEHADAARAAAEAQEVIEALRPPQAGLDLDILNADDARRGRPSFDPAEVGMPQGDAEALALIEQIRKLTGGSPRDSWSANTKAYANAAGLTPDLGAIKAGRASDRPTTETRQNADGTTTETIKRHDDHGNVLQLDEYTRNSDGTITRVSQQSIGNNGLESHVAVRNPDGSYTHSTEGRPLVGSGSSGRIWQSPNWDATVDPDGAHGKGGGDLPGKKRKTVWDSVAGSRTPGGRPPSPEDQGGVGGPRLNVDVDLAGQPNPDQAAGGSAVGRMIRNPNDDTVDPPRPIK